MTDRPLLRGTFVPLVTPFDDQDRVDFDSLERLAGQLITAGAAGIVALATTGESTALDDNERRDVLTACARVGRDAGVPVIAGAGTNDTRTAIARHEALADVPGVVASLAVGAVLRAPVGGRRSWPTFGSGITVSRARRRLQHPVSHRTRARGRVPAGTGGHRQCGGCEAGCRRLRRRHADAAVNGPESFAVLGGDDPYLLPVVLMGGAGAIAASAHICTERFVAMIYSGLAGNVADARVHAEALLPLVLALFAEPSPAIIKAVLQADGRIPTPNVRMPLGNASRACVDQALAVVEALAH